MGQDLFTYLTQRRRTNSNASSRREVNTSRKQSNSAINANEMGQNLFTFLPSEIILDILSRLPIRPTMRCKCVCKPWLDLLTTTEFVKFHLSKTVPGLAVFEWDTLPKQYKIIEFVDEVDLNSDEHHWNIVFNLDIPLHQPVHSSVNGLLFLYQITFQRSDLFLCNPITRDYIMLPTPPHPSSSLDEIYGFGVSRMTGQYKVVRVFSEGPRKSPVGFEFNQFEVQIYIVGTGSRRIIASASPLKYVEHMVGAFLNGNLHWLASNGSSVRISCLDLETELFSTFSPPPPPPVHDPHNYKDRILSVLGDCLCVCDNPGKGWILGFEIDIRLMKEYGDEKSWKKEFVIRKAHMDGFLGYLIPIKVFKDGDILMTLGSSRLLYYSSRTKFIQEVDLAGLNRDIFTCTTAYAPSFVPLKTFVMENVGSF